MNFILKQYDKNLLWFEYIEENFTRKCHILKIDNDNSFLLPIGLDLNDDGIFEWLKTRIIPKNRTYSYQLLLSMGLSNNDVIGIIKQTSHIIHEKVEVQQQIDTIITGKRLEQRVMVCMPLVITLYLRLTSPKYIDVLYGNVMGIIVMTICLLIYAAAVMLAQKITDINI